VPSKIQTEPLLESGHVFNAGTSVDESFMSTEAVSFAPYLLDHEGKRPELGVEFCHLMVQLAFAAKIIAREITRAALINRIGLVDTQNATDDAQKILGVFTNDTMAGAFARTGLVAEIVSGDGRIEARTGRSQCSFLICARIRSAALLTPMRTEPSVRFSPPSQFAKRPVSPARR
jgi:hypothetical protein